MDIERNIRYFNVLLKMEQAKFQFSHLLLCHWHTHLVVFVFAFTGFISSGSVPGVHVGIEIRADGKMDIRMQEFISAGLARLAGIGCSRKVDKLYLVLERS